jgi:hypothetical protein
VHKSYSFGEIERLRGVRTLGGGEIERLGGVRTLGGGEIERLGETSKNIFCSRTLGGGMGCGERRGLIGVRILCGAV